MDLVFGPTTDWSFFSQRLAGCSCLKSCSDTCPCINRSSTYEQGCLTSEYLSSVLSSLPLPPIFECNSECSCDPELCNNRVVQRRLENSQWLSVRHVSDARHHGVFTSRVIGPGECVCVYAGEVISCEEAARREKDQLENLGHTYILTIKESRLSTKRTTSGQSDHTDGKEDDGGGQTAHRDRLVDNAGQESRKETEGRDSRVETEEESRKETEGRESRVEAGGRESRVETEGRESRVEAGGQKSRVDPKQTTCMDLEGQTTCVDGFMDSEDEEQAVASFINHSCSPNCVLLPVRVDHMIPYCAVFASRKINIDEEVTFDYGMQCELSDRPCLCRSNDCRGFLPRFATAFERE